MRDSSLAVPTFGASSKVSSFFLLMLLVALNDAAMSYRCVRRGWLVTCIGATKLGCNVLQKNKDGNGSYSP